MGDRTMTDVEVLRRAADILEVHDRHRIFDLPVSADAARRCADRLEAQEARRALPHPDSFPPNWGPGS